MHNTIVDWIPPASAYGLPLNETTLAQKMQEAGYACHATGKVRNSFFPFPSFFLSVFFVLLFLFARRRAWPAALNHRHTPVLGSTA